MKYFKITETYRPHLPMLCKADSIETVINARYYESEYEEEVTELTEAEFNEARRSNYYDGEYPNPETKEMPEIGDIVCDDWNGCYYVVGIDGDVILLRGCYKEDGKLFVTFDRLPWDMEEFKYRPHWNVVERAEDVKAECEICYEG